MLAASAALSACVANPPPSSSATLAETVWALHAIQSMDDAQGTTCIADPQRFTLRFDANGRARLRLDCNRGTGTWKATPSADGASGQLQFGPIAATRALCPPPHLDERVARDLGNVRSYLLKDGKLFLSLMADGGIYEWHPARE
jgi:heat shock protein HslJ